ncbi:MAG: hypothetical protein AAF281_00410 [Pseudomonadota bacterium]
MTTGNIDGFAARSTHWPGERVGVGVMCNREEAPDFRIPTNDIADLLLPLGSA